MSLPLKVMFLRLGQNASWLAFFSITHWSFLSCLCSASLTSSFFLLQVVSHQDRVKPFLSLQTRPTFSVMPTVSIPYKAQCPHRGRGPLAEIHSKAPETLMPHLFLLLKREALLYPSLLQYFLQEVLAKEDVAILGLTACLFKGLITGA